MPGWLTKSTVLRVVLLVAWMVAWSVVHDGLPNWARGIAFGIMWFGAVAFVTWWRHGFRLRADEGSGIDRPDVVLDFPEETGVGRRVWRVRGWVRLVSVAVPLAGLPFVLWPRLLNPDWKNGLPTSELVYEVIVYAVLGLIVWAAFRSRLEVDDERVKVVNPWRTRSFARADVRGARAGAWGLELLVDDGRVIVFAVQCPDGLGVDPPPRWVEVARTVTGRDPLGHD